MELVVLKCAFVLYLWMPLSIIDDNTITTRIVVFIKLADIFKFFTVYSDLSLAYQRNYKMPILLTLN